jgi:thiol-disulfide isomerase/thioredoxin
MSFPNAGERAEPEARPIRPAQRGFFRRIIFPVIVVAVIAGVIWWLDSRDNGAVSPGGERYGPVALPAALRTSGLTVAAEQGALAPDFLLERLDDGELRLSEFRGRAVVLNFWATWCEPCRKEMPLFVEAYDRYRDEGLEIVAVNLQEGKDGIRGFAADFGMDFAIGIDRDGEVGDDYRLLGLPTTFFIDPNGVVQHVFRGPVIEEDQDTNVQSAIEGSELEARIAEILPPTGTD